MELARYMYRAKGDLEFYCRVVRAVGAVEGRLGTCTERKWIWNFFYTRHVQAFKNLNASMSTQGGEEMESTGKRGTMP